MTTYILIAATALALAVGSTPVARQIAWRVGAIDRPSARKVHTHPMPRLGGVAIYVAFAVALILLGDRTYVHQVIGIFLGATLVSFLGVWDDRQPLRPFVKLIGQMAATLILIETGVRVSVFHWPWLNTLVTIFWVVGITNALNLLDNMDGLSGGVAAIASAFFLLLAAMSGQYLVGALTAALFGACLGFLAYNFNPASIFMGDSGSLFLGFMLAAVGIKLRFPDNVSFVTWMVPVLVLGVPIFDTTLVFVSRLRRGVNPLTAAGKDHLSHRLVRELKASHREAVLMIYLIAGALGVISIFITEANVVEGYLVGGLVALTGLWALWRLEWNRRVNEDGSR